MAPLLKKLSVFRGAQRRQRTQRSWLPCTTSWPENPLLHNGVLNADSHH